MSLINDALKRATRNQPTAAAVPAPEPAAPMQPVEYRRQGLPWYFFPALLAIVAVACWFIVKGVQAHRESSSPVPKPILVQAREPESQIPAPASARAADAEASQKTANNLTSTPLPAPNNNPPSEAAKPAIEASAAPPLTAPAPAPPPEPPKPAYRLQGIFFRTGNPSALVNGKNVWVGSRIDGAIVKSITRDSLTIEVDGQTTVLTFN
jgi:hypothetical protein